MFFMKVIVINYDLIFYWRKYVLYVFSHSLMFVYMEQSEDNISSRDLFLLLWYLDKKKTKKVQIHIDL